jgi:hypothetical protein
MSDTLSTLRTALAPKTGMQRIPFPLESYEHPSLPLSAKRLINLMAEQQPADARTAAALVSTPTLKAWNDPGLIGPGPIRAINDEMPGLVYLISGTGAYRLVLSYPGGVAVNYLGDLGALAAVNPWESSPTIAAGPSNVVFCNPPRAYTCTHAATSLTQITDADFSGASSVAYCDGYFAFSSTGDTARWFISKLRDPVNYDALDFAYSDALPNLIRRVINHRGQIWTIGEGGFEVWYDAGKADFAFRRAAGGVVPVGTHSPMSVCKIDQSVWWVGVDGIVWRSEGYTPRRASTHAIEAIVGPNSLGLQALSHPYRGHWFYCLTTQDNRTLVYDIATAVWHERSTSTDGSAPWQAATSACDNNRLHLLGDRATGLLYTLTMFADDAGVTVIRQATLPTIWAGTNRAFCARVEIEMESGGSASPGAVQLEWSDDGARTWKASRTMNAGAPGDYTHRVYTTRLGAFRQRTFRITTHGVTRLFSVDAELPVLPQDHFS